MTASRFSKQKRNPKTVPKRAVSFCPTAKPEAPSRGKPRTDGDLQSVNSRRRYMRRGSKCPSMFRASFISIDPLLDSPTDTFFSCATPKDLTFPATEKELKHRNQAQRRMSLMSALKISLEKASIVDHGPPTPMKVERRLSTYQLLSQV